MRMSPPTLSTAFTYPRVRRDESLKETYHGTTICDPYRWLEDPDSEETKAFIEAQNQLTKAYLESYPARNELRKRLTDLWNYEKYSCPTSADGRYFYFKNTGLQNHSVMYVQNTLEDEPSIFLDPNTLSSDGTVALTYYKFSMDDRILGYYLAKNGSDWNTLKFKNTFTGEEYPDTVEKVKFSQFSWTHDSLGVFYARFPDVEGKSDGTETTMNTNHKLYYHRIGTPQSQDTLVVEFKQNPNWRISAKVTECGNFLIVLPRDACRDNMVYYASLIEPIRSGLQEPLSLLPIVTEFGAEFYYVTSEASDVVFLTNKNAPNYQLLKIDLKHPSEENWTVLVAEHLTNVLQWAVTVNIDKLVLCYLEDVKNVLELRDLEHGRYLQRFPIDIGTVTAHSGRKGSSEFFFSVSSFLSPGRIHRVDFRTSAPFQAEVLWEIRFNDLDLTNFTTKQVFYSSKDAITVPMFIAHKKEITLDGSMPCHLYGYGGFNVSTTPTFQVWRFVYMNHFNGVIALANIRGGGEYGSKWHDQGRQHKKQNSYDDFQAAAEYLIRNKYTTAKKLTIEGLSNGGILIGACLNQRPDLFGTGIAHVGIMDMLRFHKFTCGSHWSSEYGCSDSKEFIDTLLKYSPLHNIRLPKGVEYPALLLLTGDHDDRVVPSHSYKFIAEIQYQLGTSTQQKNPLMIRIDTNSGHGLGKPISKYINQCTDVLCFIAKSQDLCFTERAF